MSIIKDWVTFSEKSLKLIDKDNLDSHCYASKNPAPNTIPISDDNGKLANGWLNASSIPTANTIPIANSQGKLDSGWLPRAADTGIRYYSRYYVQTSFPSSPQLGDMVFRSDEKKLYRWNDSNWDEIDWQVLVRYSPEWIAGRLRINSSTSDLEISPNGTNWYVCYPLVGASSYRIMTFDNSNFTQKYFMPPNTQVVLTDSNHMPIVFSLDVISKFEVQVSNFETISGAQPLMIRVSNVATTYVVVQIYKNDGPLGAGSIFDFQGIKIGWLAHTPLNYSVIDMNVSSIEIQVVLLNLHRASGSGLQITSARTTPSSTFHWLGTLGYGTSEPNWTNYIRAGHIAITRRA